MGTLRPNGRDGGICSAGSYWSQGYHTDGQGTVRPNLGPMRVGVPAQWTNCCEALLTPFEVGSSCPVDRVLSHHIGALCIVGGYLIGALCGVGWGYLFSG